MSNLPFFDFSAYIAKLEEDSPSATRNDAGGKMKQKNPDDQVILDKIKGIFDDKGSGTTNENYLFKMSDAKERMFPPGLALPNPVFSPKEQVNNLRIPQFGMLSPTNSYEGHSIIEPQFGKPKNIPHLAFANGNYPWLTPKNSSSKAFYNVQVNDDIFLIERIESILAQISSNYDPYCPSCLKYIDLKKSNFQNVSAYFSKTARKYYLTHFDCYFRIKNRSLKIRNLSEVPAAKLNYQEQSLDLSQFVRRDRKIHFISFEALHTISSYVHFKIERSTVAVEEPLQGKQILLYNFEKKGTSIYEPSAHVIFYPEFRCQLIVASCPSNEEPFTFEFSINASTVNLSVDAPERSIEFVHDLNGNHLRMGFQAVLDIDNKIIKNLNYKIPVPDRLNSQEPLRIFILKYVIVALPLIRKTPLDVRICEDNEGSLLSKHINQTKAKGLQNIDTQFKEENSLFSAETDTTNDQMDPWMFMGELNSNVKRKEMKSLTENFKVKPLNPPVRPGFSSPGWKDLEYCNRAVQKVAEQGFKSFLAQFNPNLDNHTNLQKHQGQSFSPTYESDEAQSAEQPFKLSDYQGMILEVSKTPAGAKSIQAFIPKATSAEIDAIINELKPNLIEVLLDPYANNMFQALMQHASLNQRLFLLSNITLLVPQLACHKKGTHSLQAIISIIKGDEEEQLFEASLDDHILELSKDLYGTHFVQKLISCLSSQRINQIFKNILNVLIELSKNSYGLCVVKALVNRIEKDNEKKRILIDFVSQNLDELIEDSLGNYAIQHVLEVFSQDCAPICEEVLSKLLLYSNQKFSSNVVEKCIETASPEIKRKFTDAFTKNERLIELMTNKYGNFVLKKVYGLCSDREKKNLLASLQKGFSKIHSSKYKTRWTSFFEEFAKKPSDQWAKPIDKQSKCNKEAGSNEESKHKGLSDIEDDEDSDDVEQQNTKFPGRKNTKRVTYVDIKPTQDAATVERSKNRKNSAPINGLKFSTNFP